ncbi:MAG: mRNA interferase [Chloroflexi bacterium]|nr:MAG: mRNA interferase [Chloroflexota bacterium]
MFRGEVWRMSLAASDPKRNAANTRAVVILSSDSLGVLPLKVIVPLTLWKNDYTSAPWMVRLPPVLNSGLDVPMSADALQVRSVSSGRLVERMGELPSALVAEIASAVSLVIEGKTRR